MMKTYLAPAKQSKRKWQVIDAKGKVLGRVATSAAAILRGKTKSTFTPSVDCGDGVIIINVRDIITTGKKMEQKLYKRYSGYPDGLKHTPLETMMKNKPEEVMRHAVKGMLPRGPLGRAIFRNLKVYAGSDYPAKTFAPKKAEVQE